MNWFLSIAALFIALGRFTIPGHGLTGWPGAYEAFAHLLLGAMIAIAMMQERPEHLTRTYAWLLIGALILIELAMFKAQG